MNTQELKKEYEIAFLVKDRQGEAALDGLLKQFGAEVSYKSQLSEIRLAYPVKKQKQAIFGFLNFSMAPESVKDLKQALNLSPAILRSLIVSMPSGKTEKFRSQKPEYRSEPRGQAGVKKQESGELPVTARGGVLSNEALEKTLEEILK